MHRKKLKFTSVVPEIPAAFEHPSVKFWHCGDLVKSVCEFLQHMKVRHSLYMYLRLRCVSRTVLQATHIPMNAACSAMIMSLGEQNEYYHKLLAELHSGGIPPGIQLRHPLETYSEQYTALKKVIAAVSAKLDLNVEQLGNPLRSDLPQVKLELPAKKVAACGEFQTPSRRSKLFPPSCQAAVPSTRRFVRASAAGVVGSGSPRTLAFEQDLYVRGCPERQRGEDLHGLVHIWLTTMCTVWG